MTQLADSTTYTADEMMAVAAARRLRDGAVCFVGIGLPSRAANLARATHAPDCVLVYESGAIGAKPAHLPLSIGDGELAETADAVVSVPEIFGYWLQGGRIDVGFLGAAQIDRFGNLNSTVIGSYDEPQRAPARGGRRARDRRLVPRDVRDAEADDEDVRRGARLPHDLRSAGVGGAGVTCVVTDLGVLEPDDSGELTLTELHPDVGVEQAHEATGWPLRVAERLRSSPAPTSAELEALRALKPAKGETAAR